MNFKLVVKTAIKAIMEIYAGINKYNYGIIAGQPKNCDRR
jgi:hypothetical protein